MNKKSIILIGARIDGHAGVVIDTIESIGTYDIVGFIDNTPELAGKKVKDIPVLGSTDDLETINISADCVHIAIGDNIARGKIFKILNTRGINVETIIHPSSQISSNSNIGEGCFIGARSVINNGVKIGDACIINTGAIVEHDNKIGFAVHLAPGINTAGRVKVNDYSFVGVGSTILPDINIGSCALIGAGSTVVKDVPDKTTIIGYAARKHIKNIYSEARSDVDSGVIYIAQPTLPDYSLIDNKFRNIASSLQLSNFSRYAQELEKKIENYIGVNKALTFPNGTSALMLALKAFDLKGEVILPSFTFSATGNAVVWNGLKPIFADIDLETFNIDPDDVERKITEKTQAIVGVHIFGNPCNIELLEKIAEKHNLKLIFDSAHALGSFYKGNPIGSFGDVECFSLSGTKVVTSAEGGIATSKNINFMEKMSLGRNYGAGDDYDCQYIGLNGKMSEFHAAIALESLALIDEFVKYRNLFVDQYKERLNEIPGIRFQRINDNCISTYKDFGVIINKKQFGITRDELAEELKREKIYTKKYFFPPLHKMKAYKSIDHRAENLNNTDYITNNILCLPLFSHMTSDTVDKVCYAINRIYQKNN